MQTAGFATPVPESVGDDTVEPELAELFADDLADLPAEPDLPEEVFAEAAGEPVSSLAPTAEMPQFDQSGEVYDPTADGPTAEMGALADTSEETVDVDLSGLADTQGDETQLSATLQEALSLLESDFENELTASQIIDQSAIRRALDEEETEILGGQKNFPSPMHEEPLKILPMEVRKGFLEQINKGLDQNFKIDGLFN